MELNATSACGRFVNPLLLPLSLHHRHDSHACAPSNQPFSYAVYRLRSSAASTPSPAALIKRLRIPAALFSSRLLPPYSRPTIARPPAASPPSPAAFHQ
jgi:hypothetical protein